MIEIWDAAFFRDLVAKPNAADRVQRIVERLIDQRDAAINRAECAEAGFGALKGQGA